MSERAEVNGRRSSLEIRTWPLQFCFELITKMTHPGAIYLRIKLNRWLGIGSGIRSIPITSISGDYPTCNGNTSSNRISNIIARLACACPHFHLVGLYFWYSTSKFFFQLKQRRMQSQYCAPCLLARDLHLNLAGLLSVWTIQTRSGDGAGCNYDKTRWMACDYLR